MTRLAASHCLSTCLYVTASVGSTATTTTNKKPGRVAFLFCLLFFFFIIIIIIWKIHFEQQHKKKIITITLYQECVYFLSLAYFSQYLFQYILMQRVGRSRLCNDWLLLWTCSMQLVCNDSRRAFFSSLHFSSYKFHN